MQIDVGIVQAPQLSTYFKEGGLYDPSVANSQ
jgi:hypothetical protein